MAHTLYDISVDKRLFSIPSGTNPKNRGGILHAHGWNPGGSNNAVQFLPGGSLGDTITRLANYGFANLGGDLGGDSTWGNPTGVTAVGTYLTAIRANYAHATKKIGLVGYSMGSMNVLNYARANLANIGAICLQIPVVNGEDVRSNNRAGAQAAFELAWVNNAGWQAARATSNPVEYAAQLSSIPILIYYSTNDPTAIPAEIMAFAATHGNCVLVSLGAIGHALTGLNPTLAAEFFTKYLT